MRYFFIKYWKLGSGKMQQSGEKRGVGVAAAGGARGSTPELQTLTSCT